MATTLYEKIGFKDRQDSKPDSYLVNGVATSITKDNSGLVQTGTNLNQENLDHMEEGILQNSRDIRTLDTTVGEHTAQLADIATQLSNYNSYSSGKDSNGIFTVVEYKRSDTTLYMKSTLSNVDTNGNYKTDTWQFYDNDGINVVKTLIWTITYDSEGKITSKVVA